MDINAIGELPDIKGKTNNDKLTAIQVELKKRYDKTLEDAGDRMYDEIRAVVLGKDRRDYILQPDFANE